jgi:AraC-like DNA-binding protein
MLTAGIMLWNCQNLWADELEQRFEQDVQPVLQKYCVHCHSGDEPEAKFLITQFVNARSIVVHWQSWEDSIRRISDREMPPPEEPQLAESERTKIVEWSRAFEQQQAEKFKGDPGPISVRRLNAAEWNHSIRDLIGYDIQAAKDFPIDPANAAGFDNSAESLTMSPGLLNKYMLSARHVAEHLLLTPDGIRFAPFPVVTETDRDRYCVQRIVDFYRQQPTDLAAYFNAARAWILSKSANQYANVELVAKEFKLSPKYLQTVLVALQDESVQYGPLKEVQLRLRGLLDPKLSVDEVEKGCEEIRRYIVGQRDRLIPAVNNLRAPGGINGGSQPLVLWKNRQMAANRLVCRSDGFTTDPETSVFSLELREKYPTLNSAEKGKILKDFEKFCRLFPDAFYIAERGRAHIDPKEAAREGKGRLLSAGFHSMMGYFRDDQPLYELILSTEEQKQLDLLWNELDFISQVPVRQYAGHLWFERAEASFLNDPRFDFVRAEDKAASRPDMIQKFASVYQSKLKEMLAEVRVVEAVEYYFEHMNQRLRQLEKELQIAEPKQIESLLNLLEPMFRRTVSEAERENWRWFYAQIRALPTADHRSALEDTLVAMLLSPQHLYRWDLRTDSFNTVALNSQELASRWSFLLWTSAPDSNLRNAADAGVLTDQEGIHQQFQRMIHDERFEGMVREFLGNWLDFRRFESHNGVDRSQYPDFDNRLRQAMFEEPIHYFIDLVRRDGRMIELIESDHSIVNKSLADYYGFEGFDEQSLQEWQRVSGVKSSQRGGLLSMGVFLTQNSPGLRTSPVKRGYWVVRRILGERIPAPPPNVPELPNSERDLGTLTLREALEKHREHPSCAGCHARFDSFGLLLEGFDPIGRTREKDLAGNSISTMAKLPDGNDAQGIAGLQHYVAKNRGDDFRRHFCETLVAFGLGRTLILSDRLLVDEMMTAMREQDDRIQAAFLVLLKGAPFQRKRGANLETEEFNDVSK